VKIEIADARGNTVAKASGKLEANPDGKAGGDDKDDDDDGPPKRKLEPKPGLNRFVWDLTHDGATVIPGAPVDSGSAAARVPVAPGTYTVKLTAGNQTLTQSVEVKCDPRVMPDRKDVMTYQVHPVQGLSGPGPVVEVTDGEGKRTTHFAALGIPMPSRPGTYQLVPVGGTTVVKPADLASQEQLSLRVRDDISKLADTVSRLRAVKKQIGLRKELLKDRDDAKELLKQSEALDKTLDGIEEKLHNPRAKISYDIFAARGGAMLYSQFAWLLSNLVDADGEPTKAQRELADDLGKQLAALVGQFEGVVKADVAKLNDAAKKLGVPELYVPPEKTGEKKEESKK
jgi:hypothetical protein